METIQQAVADACDMGYDVDLHFVVGAPEETWYDILESLAIVKKYPIYDFGFNNLIPYPKTELYNWVKKNKYFTIQPSTYFNDIPYWQNDPVFETPIFSLEERKKAISKALKLKTKVKIRYFKHKFKKYGFIGYIIAYAAAMSFVRDRLLKNARIKKIALGIFQRV
ncbi:MAG: hypothetical protein SCARUB_04551 [Candidatus Scalindua rubra]|uniref:Radical SAM core domain-containing protein n=1 Tax=Candidatus Scalindua rubra TaxID=1872076 RepID=A0A1E3X5V2_9BACT|nr:MAG: hypothetical protein SCARUB_04551 [Candidatus Scalindua rubra]